MQRKLLWNFLLQQQHKGEKGERSEGLNKTFFLQHSDR